MWLCRSKPCWSILKRWKILPYGSIFFLSEFIQFTWGGGYIAIKHFSFCYFVHDKKFCCNNTDTKAFCVCLWSCFLIHTISVITLWMANLKFLLDIFANRMGDHPPVLIKGIFSRWSKAQNTYKHVFAHNFLNI